MEKLNYYNMEDQRVLFETAKLAFEVGFPQKEYPCFADDGLIHTVSYFLIKEGNRYYQPTQTTLQRWLREAHNIDVYCNCIGSGSYFYEIYLNDLVDTFITQDTGCTSFEGSLELGLFEALEKIKNKQNEI